MVMTMLKNGGGSRRRRRDGVLRVQEVNLGLEKGEMAKRWLCGNITRGDHAGVGNRGR